MNKAFVRESDGDDEEALSPSLKLPPGSKNYITPAGHARLKEELEQLVKRERPNVVEIVAWAASNGDRSENGDYIYGKRRLREIDRRIRFLTKRLEIAHYSRQVSLQEIVAQDYNLNLPRYIDNGEREDIQDLNAHLYGDIPVADIDDLADFWQVFPQLKNELFEAKGKRYHAKLPAEQIKF